MNDREYDEFERSPIGRMFHDFLDKQSEAYRERDRAERTGLPNDAVRAEMAWIVYDQAGHRLCNAIHRLQKQAEMWGMRQ